MKKRTKKLFSLAPEVADRSATASKKFFASFFQKRSASFPQKRTIPIRDYRFDHPQQLHAAIFDVGDVLISVPHEQAWRMALEGFADPEKLTSEFYAKHMKGQTRLQAAAAALSALRVADSRKQSVAYAARKQEVLLGLINAGGLAAYADAMRFLPALARLGLKLAASSASSNATAMLSLFPLDEGTMLADALAAEVCGRALRHGPPDPEIFLLAAAEMGVAPAACFVVEDTAEGVKAARAAGMGVVGLSRAGAREDLLKAGADIAVASLDEVALDHLAAGKLRRIAISAGREVVAV